MRAILALTPILVCASAQAAIINVPADQPTIDAAITAAVDGDEIIVAPGVYVENLAFLNKTLVLRASDSDPANTVIDGNFVSSVFVLNASADADSRIEGFTIRNGANSGCYLNGASLTISNCIFEFNENGGGGGIYSASGEPIVEDCTFRNNVATSGGGAIRIGGGEMLVRRCDFDENEASDGSAIQQGGGFIRIVDCRFRDNLSSNAADGGTLTLSDARIVNCLLRNNDDAVAALVADGEVVAINCTVVDNAAAGFGVIAGTLEATNCIVRGNAGASVDLLGGDATITYSNIDGGYAGTGNIDEQAEFVAPNSNDFHLGPGSPCVDAGNNAAIQHQVDLDGLIRVINDPDVGDTGSGNSEIIDMGCYERLPKVRYVDADATGLGTGHTWNHAYTDLQDAMDEAHAGNDVKEIWVAAGVYKPDRGSGDRALSFEMKSDLDLLGGFIGGELERDMNVPMVNATTLSGAIGGPGNLDNTHHVVHADNVDGTGRLIGFVVQGGNAQDAIANGGGILVEDGEPVIRECLVRLNDANLGGAGLYSVDADTKIHRCRFTSNSNAASVPGSGLSFLRGDALITNTVVHGNSGDGHGQGIYELDGTLEIVNSVVYGNESFNNTCGGIFSPGGDVHLRNSIVWGNVGDSGAPEWQQFFGGGSFTVDYSLVEGWIGSTPGIETSDADPMFVDPAGPDGTIGNADDDLRLQPGSPAIDSGDNDALPGYVVFDFDGLQRYVDDPATRDSGNGVAPIVDRGAFEFVPEPCPADVTGDGVVDVQDLVAVITAWGPCAGCGEDIDGSGAVDVGDLVAVIVAWGDCS